MKTTLRFIGTMNFLLFPMLYLLFFLSIIFNQPLSVILTLLCLVAISTGLVYLFLRWKPLSEAFYTEEDLLSPPTERQEAEDIVSYKKAS